MIALGKICDPIIMNPLVNHEARVTLFLLPDDIFWMSEKDQEAHVRLIITMTPKYRES
jgi:hypothetical protein